MSPTNLDPPRPLFTQHMGRISRQASIYFLGMVFSVVAGYFFKVYVARVLGPDNLGLYALGMRMVDLLALFAAMGATETAARFVSVFKAENAPGRIRLLFTVGLRVVTLASVALAVLLVLIREWMSSRVLETPALAPYLILFALLLPLGTLNAFLGGYLRGHQEIARRTVINSFVQFPVKIVTTVVLFVLGLSLSGYVVGDIVALTVAVALLLRVSMRLTPGRKSGGESLPHRDIVDFAGSMVGLGVLGFLSAKLAEPILAVYLDASDVGIYSVALTTASFVPVLLQSLNSIFGPIISELHRKGDLGMVARLYQTSTKWCLALTWPLVCVLVFHAEDLMRIFGPEFARGGTALAVLAAAQFVNVASGSAGQILVMTGRPRVEVGIQIIAAVLSIVGLLAWVPGWGVSGAALAFGVVIATSNVLRVTFVFTLLSLSPYNRRYLKLSLPMLLAGAAVYLLHVATVGMGELYWVRPVLGLLVAYAILIGLALSQSLDADDRLIWNAVLSRTKFMKTGKTP